MSSSSTWSWPGSLASAYGVYQIDHDLNTTKRVLVGREYKTVYDYPILKVRSARSRRWLRENDIRGISPRPWRPVTTIVDPSPHAIPDLVQRRFDQGALNVVWTSDITYLATGEGWLYLAAVRDGCSRRVLGYAFSDSLHTDLVESALAARSPSAPATPPV